MLVIRKQAAAEEPSATGGAKVDSAKRVAFGKHATGVENRYRLAHLDAADSVKDGCRIQT